MKKIVVVLLFIPFLYMGNPKQHIIQLDMDQQLQVVQVIHSGIRI